MYKISKIIILCLTMILLFSSTVFAKEYTNLEDLVEKAKGLDGKIVSIRGEAIGEPLKRGNYTWINVGDGSMALGVWMKGKDAAKISIYGNSKYKGDIVEITGILNRACKEHGGDMDMHAEKVEILSNGYRNKEIVNKSKEDIAIILTVISTILVLVYLKKVKFKR